MSGAVYKAASGALLQQMRLDMLSNNLANVNTTGYKTDVPIFRVPNENGVAPPSTAAGTAQLNPYASPMSARTDFSPGALAKTGNALDVAIVGKGFFEVQAPEGSQFTRKGNFTINEEGVLSTAEGWPVMGQGGAIAIEGSRIDINDQGEVFVDGDPVDALRVVDFEQPDQLRKVGDTFFVPGNGEEPTDLEDGTVQVAQGFLEKSNVDIIRTMTDLIETVRVFESYQRVMRSADEADAKTVSEVGKI